MAIKVLKNATLLDCTGCEPKENAYVVVDDDKIREVGTGKAASSLCGTMTESIDCKGHFLMPGLIDAHIHLSLFDNDFGEQHRRSHPAMHYVKALGVLKDTLEQGFTTVRDAGGADAGFRVAVEEGLVPGPRITVCGRVLTQTGGHADPRLSTELTGPAQSPFSAVVADGVTEVTKAAREQLRQGADHLKVIAGGGCASPADEPDATQYSFEEIHAIVKEGRAANKDVLAHCYSNASIRLAAEAGVYSIEHGNYLDVPTAQFLKTKDCWLVPTLTTYFFMAENGKELGIPGYFLRKMKQVLDHALEAVKNAVDAGVKIGSGSDVIGSGQMYKNRELELKSRVMGPIGAILSATRENAKMLRKEKNIGTVEVGKDADLILLSGNPLDDISLFNNRDNVLAVMQRGYFCKKLI